MVTRDQLHGGFPLSCQLNVFYNVWGHDLTRRRRHAHGAEAFRLSVELSDLDARAAHLFICCR